MNKSTKKILGLAVGVSLLAVLVYAFIPKTPTVLLGQPVALNCYVHHDGRELPIKGQLPLASIDRLRQFCKWGSGCSDEKWKIAAEIDVAWSDGSSTTIIIGKKDGFVIDQTYYCITQSRIDDILKYIDSTITVGPE